MNDLDLELNYIHIDDECFICLELIYENEFPYCDKYIKMICCKKDIHKFCLLKSFLIKSKCPLCRQEIDIIEYLNKDLILKIFNKFSQSFKIDHLTQIKTLIGNENVNVNENIKNISCCIISICIIIILIIVIITLTRNNHTENNINSNIIKYK